MKMSKGGLVTGKFDPDHVPCLVQSGYYVPKEAIEKYGIKFLNAINKGVAMQTVPDKEDASDGTRIDSCEACSDFEIHEGGSLRCMHPDAVENIINPVTYTYAIPDECPLEEYICGCRHPECTDCFTPDTRTKHGLKDHEITLLVNAVRDVMQQHTNLQCTRGMISTAVLRYLEANDLRIDKRDW